MGERKSENEKLEKAMGLLSLAADKSDKSRGKGSSCLSAEVLAALIDGTCSTDEIEQVRRHLSSCEICYDQWLTLSSIKLGTLSSSRTAVGKKTKIYGYIGSALALAASVVVFINVTDLSFSPVKQHDTERILEKEQDYKGDDAGLLLQEEMPVPTADVVERSMELQATIPERNVRDSVSVADEAPRKKISRGPEKKEKETAFGTLPSSVAPAEKRAVLAKRRVGSAEQTLPQSDMAVKDSGLSSFERWQRTVITSCRESEQYKVNWNTHILEGKKLVGDRSRDLPLDLQKKMTSTISLLAELESGQSGDQCTDILAILGDDEVAR